MSALDALRHAIRDRSLPEPTYGKWLTHKCDPPCELMRIGQAQQARKAMSRRELLLSFEKADEAWLELHEDYGMQKGWSDQLEAHLRAHGCTDVAADGIDAEHFT